MFYKRDYAQIRPTAMIELAPTRLGQNIKEFIGMPFRKEPRTIVVEPVLPDSFRYALTYSNADVGPQELQDLNASGFINESVYLVTKALDAEKENQKAFLQDIMNGVLENPDSKYAIQPAITRHIRNMRPHTKVSGEKVAQFSRQGFDLWNDKFKDLAHDAALRTDSKVALLSYGTLMSFRHFVTEFQKTDRSFLILSPSWITDTENSDCGYEVNPNKKSVDYLSKDFVRDAKPLFVDDNYKTGQSMQKVWDFWHQEFFHGVDRSKVLVVCNIPELKTTVS